MPTPTLRGPAVLAALLAFSLGACQDQEDPSASADDSAPVVVEEQYPGEADDDVTATGTLAVIESGLATLPRSTARDYIRAWRAQLSGSRVSGGAAIAQTLGELEEALDGGRPDGSVIGPILVRLGQQTEAAASQAEGDAQATVRSLGQALGSAGRAMGGADRPLAAR